MTVRLSRVTALLAFAFAPLSVASAQITTIDFAAHGGSNGGAIAQSFGDHGNLDVSYRTRSGFGNSQLQQCNQTSFWGAGYSNLSAVTYACSNGLIGELFFQPLNGNTVFLQSLDIGSYSSTNGIGPIRSYDLGVFDTSWNLLYSTSGTVAATVNLTPNVSSASGLYLQWGADWNTGINNITTDVAGTVVATPEPSSMILLATGFVGIVGFARRRRAAA